MKAAAALVFVATGVYLWLVLPHPPSHLSAQQWQPGIELVDLARPGAQVSKRNLVFVALDPQIQNRLAWGLGAISGGGGVETLVWWATLPAFEGTYRHILRILPDHVTREAVDAALAWMEAQDMPYDVVLLTHGLPNHIAVTPGARSIDDEDIRAWRLPHLGMVFMQGCDSASLILDWHEAGAKDVVAFAGPTANFFYYPELAKALQSATGSVDTAYHVASASLGRTVRYSPLYRLVLLIFGLSVADVLAPPVLSSMPQE